MYVRRGCILLWARQDRLVWELVHLGLCGEIWCSMHWDQQLRSQKSLGAWVGIWKSCMVSVSNLCRACVSLHHLFNTYRPSDYKKLCSNYCGRTASTKLTAWSEEYKYIGSKFSSALALERLSLGVVGILYRRQHRICFVVCVIVYLVYSTVHILGVVRRKDGGCF